MADAKHKRGVIFWAWMVSIALHLVILIIFGVTKFSRCSVQCEQQNLQAAKINCVKKFLQAEIVIPKPKVRQSSNAFRADSASFPMEKIFDIGKDFATLPDFESPDSFETTSQLSPDDFLPGSVEFFGSRTDRRKICYVVDCSGSMKGLFKRVKQELKTSIETLRQDQFFYVIFFGDDTLFEFNKGKLIRATERSKSKACNFIDTISPAGQTNALQALEKAVRIRDAGGLSHTTIFFLTDGFELTAEDTWKVDEKIENLLVRFAADTKINTIGFWPQSGDRQILEMIARKSGGEFICVTDDN